MALENQASSDRAGYRIPGADHRKWPCRSRSRAVVHLLRGWSGHLLEVNLAWTGSMPSLVVAAGRAKIGLEHQQVIGTPVEDLAGDRLLAAHGIQRHDAVRQGQRLEQRRDRGDLVRLAIDLTLAKSQTLLTGPGADQVQRPLGPAEGAAQGFAVNRHDFPIEGLGKGLSPGAEAGLEGVDQHEDP